MGKRGIVIKTLQNNKKLLAATIGAVLLHLPTVIQEFGYGYGALYIVADSVFWLIALLLVVGSFVLNLNGKAKPAIICAAASAIVGGVSALIQGYRVFEALAFSILWLIALLLVVGSFVLHLNDKAKPAIACAAASAIVVGVSALIQGSGIFAILNILPQIMLIVFLLKQNVVNRHTWVYLTLAAVILSEIIGMIIMIIHWQHQIPVSSIVSSRIISLLCNALPLGLVYWFGYTADNDATQQPDVVQKTTESSYLEAYKLNRKNGGK